jgi:hypothetical protein
MSEDIISCPKRLQLALLDFSDRPATSTTQTDTDAWQTSAESDKSSRYEAKDGGGSRWKLIVISRNCLKIKNLW